MTDGCCLKNDKSPYPATVWPIATEFGRLTHSDQVITSIVLPNQTAKRCEIYNFDIFCFKTLALTTKTNFLPDCVLSSRKLSMWEIRFVGSTIEVLIKTTICTEMSKIQFDESLWCTISTGPANQKLLVGLIYRSPSSSCLNNDALLNLIETATEIKDITRPHNGWHELSVDWLRN